MIYSMGITEEKIVLFMKMIVICGIFSAFLTSIIWILGILSSKVRIMGSTDPTFFSNVVFCIDVFIAAIYYLNQRKKRHIIKFNNQNEISYFVIFLDRYSFLIPSFLFSIGWFILLAGPYEHYAYYAYLSPISFFILLNLYPLVFLIMFLLKQASDNNINITLKIANYIFINYLDKTENIRNEKFYAEKFTYYFIRSINNINIHLPKGVGLKI
jgi:hypothetical protein